MARLSLTAIQLDSPLRSIVPTSIAPVEDNGVWFKEMLNKIWPLIDRDFREANNSVVLR